MASRIFRLGWRFQRSVEIFPGVRVNFSKSGLSTSLGSKGATINFSRRGKRTTLGIPGTGLSHSTFEAANGDSGVDEVSTEKQETNWIGWGLGFLGLIGLGQCFGDPSSQSQPPQKAAFATGQTSDQQKVPETTERSAKTTMPTSEPVVGAGDETINVTSANGRGDPTRTGPVVVVLKSGDRVRVLKNQNGWKQVVKDGITFWILAQQLERPHTSKHHETPPPISSAPRKEKVILPKKQKKAASASTGCSCGSGRMCTGPRDGVYCLTASGNKNYER